MSGNNNINPFDGAIKLDGNGMPILGNNTNNILKKGSNINEVIDDDIASEEDIEIALYGNTESNDELEEFNQPKLSKSGKSGVAPQLNNINTQPQQHKPQVDVNNIEDHSIKYLVESAEKTNHKISINLEIQSIDKGLFDILKKSYKNKSDKILQLIIDSNIENIEESIKKSIEEYYEKQHSEES